MVKFYLIEDYGYDGLQINECSNIKKLKKAIKESDALDIWAIKGRDLKIEIKYQARVPYWDKTKPTKIPELNIEIEGNKREK